MANKTINDLPESDKPDPGNPTPMTRFDTLRHGAVACGLLLEFLELLNVEPPSGPLVPATELSFSKDDIRARLFADPVKYLEDLATIETRLRLSHIWPGNLNTARTFLEAWASLTSFTDSPEEFARILYVIE